MVRSFSSSYDWIKLSIENAFKIDTTREINKKTNIVLKRIASN